MNLLLTKLENITLIIITIPHRISPLYLLFLVRRTTSGRLHSEFVCLLFLQAHRETDRFFSFSGVHHTQGTSGHFHLHLVSFFSQLKTKVDLVLAKTTALRITLNIDDTPIDSR